MRTTRSPLAAAADLAPRTAMTHPRERSHSGSPGGLSPQRPAPPAYLRRVPKIDLEISRPIPDDMERSAELTAVSTDF